MSRIFALARLLAAFSILCRFAPLAVASDPLFEQAQKKMDLLDSGRVARGSVVFFSPAEINAWVRGKAPIALTGVREPYVELGLGTVRGSALVDLVQMRQAQGAEVNSMIAAMIAGEHPVYLSVRVESALGKATVFLDEVQFSGASLSGSLLSFLYSSFFQPIFPDAKIDRPFPLKEPIERLDVRPDGVRVWIKK